MPLSLKEVHHIGGPYVLSPFEEQHIFSPRLQSIYATGPECYVQVGNFVMLHDNHVVCLHYTNSNTKQGTLYAPHTSPRSLIHLSLEDRSALEGIVELLKTSTYMVFNESAIVGHAIVLQPHVLVNSCIQGHGMENIFVCCQGMDRKGVVYDLTSGELPVFVCERPFSFPSCTAKKFFNSLLQIQEIFRQCLHRNVDDNLSFAQSSNQLYLDPDVWRYIKGRLMHHCPTIRVQDSMSSSLRSALLNGCVMTYRRSPNRTIHMSLRTTDQIRALEFVLGNTVLFGLQETQPTATHSTKCVRVNDSFNVVRLIRENDTSAGRQVQSNEYGVHLMYDMTYQLLCVRVCYENWTYTTDVNGKPFLCPLQSLESMLLAGTTFSYEDDYQNNRSDISDELYNINP